MIKSRSRWVIDVLEVKKRKLEWITSSKREALEKLSRISPLTRLEQEGIIATKRNDPVAASPHKKRGGRKRLATEKQRFYMIGCFVDRMFSRFESAFAFLKQLKVNGNSDLNTYRTELLKLKFAPNEIDCVLQARTPRAAAKRFVAKSFRIRLSTVNGAYSRYLKASKSKGTLR